MRSSAEMGSFNSSRKISDIPFIGIQQSPVKWGIISLVGILTIASETGNNPTISFDMKDNPSL
jgi:hypothetical protein